MSFESSGFNSSIYIVAIAASAGGLRAISEVVSGLPADFPAAVVIVQHLDPNYRSHLSSILSRQTDMKVKEAAEGDEIAPGHALIAPPNRHMLINSDGSVSLTHSELVYFVRPSADLLFESVSASFEERAVAVVLSGTGSDGSMGVQAIKKMRGIVISSGRAYLRV